MILIVGTSMTGRLVAAVGFHVKLEALALPLVGAGMLARLLGSRGRMGSLGETVAGFGQVARCRPDAAEFDRQP